ncbi:MAG TPA: SMP-30/gluconolactonase/LRE family protein [Gemmatimonadaceae bacterium]|jgi:YVTN family beta-propeller protein|nr:SMP-30/gluconolactonase/LRE family protein [Gemmatimonadaceae bacterium]
MRRSIFAVVVLSTLAVSCKQHGPESLRSGDSSFTKLGSRLPTGVRLDPAASLSPIGPMALTMRLTPEGNRVAVSLGGYAKQGVQIIDVASGQVVQELPQGSAFVGLAFSPDRRTLYSSGGNDNVIYRYDWRDGRASLRDSIRLGVRRPRETVRYPAGIAVSPDGRTLYVAENLTDSLSAIDAATGAVVQRLATERYPYDVVVDARGTVYVSAWGGNTVSEFQRAADGSLRDAGRIPVARHPSALLLSGDGGRLFIASGSTDQVAVLDTKSKKVVTRLLDPPPAGPGEGATPNGLALSADGTRLFVAEADANAVAVFNLSSSASGVATASGDDKLAGRIPAGWYPSSLLVVGDQLEVASGKGRGSVPNPKGPNPEVGRTDEYSLNTIIGAVMKVPLSETTGEPLSRYTARVASANGWTRGAVRSKYPPFEHVIYIVKENRTYDQVFGDDTKGDGDSSLVFFPRALSVNHHALADRFGLFDRFFVNAEVSPDGHNWSMAAYATDYLEKTVPSNYSGRGRSYDYEGTNRGRIPDDDAAEPASGYLWNLAEKKGITYRNYGEFVVPSRNASPDDLPPGYRGNKPFLRAHTNPLYPGFDLQIKDQHRADVWIDELKQFTASGVMPTLETVRLPNDHTSGAMAGRPSPRAAYADNDLALGRMIEALSKSPFWKNTVVFVLEDDAQNGADHVDVHRSPLLVISAYSRPGTIHRFANTTDVLRTIEEIIGLGSMSQFDYFGRPLRDIWAESPDLRAYSALTPAQSLDEMNPSGTRGARESARLDLDIEDAADEALFNHILWRTLKGPNVPYPGTHRVSARELKLGGAR